MEHAAAGEVVDASSAGERTSSIAAAVERVRPTAGWLAGWLACCGLDALSCLAHPPKSMLLSTTCPLTLCLPAQAAAVLPLPPTSTHLQFSRLHADMQEESRHDRAALQQLASSLAAPASIPLLK